MLFHAGGIFNVLTNSVFVLFFSCWMYDGKLLNERDCLSWVVWTAADELNGQGKFCWKFSIGCCDVNNNSWNCPISETWRSMKISKKLSFDIKSFNVLPGVADANSLSWSFSFHFFFKKWNLVFSFSIRSHRKTFCKRMYSAKSFSLIKPFF